jgi:hypothetical protein
MERFQTTGVGGVGLRWRLTLLKNGARREWEERKGGEEEGVGGRSGGEGRKDCCVDAKGKGVGGMAGWQAGGEWTGRKGVRRVGGGRCVQR